MDIEVFKSKFATNAVREKLYNDLLEYLQLLENSLAPYMVVVFGSYLSEKDEPQDIDILVYGYTKEIADFDACKRLKSDSPIHAQLVNITMFTISEKTLISSEKLVDKFVSSEANKNNEITIHKHIQLN